MNATRIHVCDNCLQHSCWEGIFMCWESRTAGLVLATRTQLDHLNREHPSYYQKAFEKGGEQSSEPLLTDGEVEAGRAPQ